MILTIEEAREVLRLDGDENDLIINSLLNAVPDYLEVSTGYKATRGKYSPLAKTAARFILQLWYNADGTDTEKLQRTIDNLMVALSMSCRVVQ